MSQHNKLIFVTHNKAEVESVNKYFDGELEFQTYAHDFEELKSGNVEEIVIAKVLEAYAVAQMPVIALDTGLYVKALNGFPGGYVNHFLRTVGIWGLIKIMLGEQNRECCIRQCLAYYDGKGQPKLFWGEYAGAVASKIMDKWGEYSESEIGYIFIPEGKHKTWAEMSDDERHELVKINEEHAALKKFKEWYVDHLVSEEYYNEKKRELNWQKTCDYILEKKLIVDISFYKWIKPLRLVNCVDDCIVFEYIDDTLLLILKDTVRYIKNRYGHIILDAYNYCVGGGYKNIEIKFE